MAVFRDLMEIEDFLGRQDGAMRLDELDGFLTALTICPPSMPREAWQTYLWNPEGIAPLASPFRDEAEARRFDQLIFEHQERLQYYLNIEEDFQPMFEPCEGTDELLWKDWLNAFVLGIRLVPDAWMKLADAEDTVLGRAIGVFVNLDLIVKGESDLPQETQDRAMAAAPELIRSSAQILYAAAQGLWTPEISRAALFGRGQQAIAGPKAGRNDPCPCGSGKKFKKCHGA